MYAPRVQDESSRIFVIVFQEFTNSKMTSLSVLGLKLAKGCTQSKLYVIKHLNIDSDFMGTLRPFSPRVTVNSTFIDIATWAKLVYSLWSCSIHFQTRSLMIMSLK